MLAFAAEAVWFRSQPNWLAPYRRRAGLLVLSVVSLVSAHYYFFIIDFGHYNSLGLDRGYGPFIGRIDIWASGLLPLFGFALLLVSWFWQVVYAALRRSRP
jgi:hypothetical protein